nr:MAG: hypothetical protein H4Bulk46395_000003 [Partitiviridae sp.]
MTNDSKHLSAIEAAQIEFKDSIISSKKLGTDRYTYTKNKKSQADGSTANVVIIKDQGTGTQFTLSVNVSAVTFADGKTYTTDDRLDQIQDAVSAFLLSIHEKL